MKFRASEMPRVVACLGAKKIQRAYPNTSGYAASEGTVAHKIAAGVLGGAEILSYLGQSIDNIYINQEMLHHIQLYIDDCQGGGDVEKSLQLDHEGHTLTGTPDYSCFDADTGTLKVKDLKYGYGWVEVFENWQLLAYAALLYHPGVHTAIELTIIQPRAFHPEGPVRRWTFNADLMRNYTNRLMCAMDDAAIDDPVTKTGAHCRYCRGLVGCHAARGAAGYAIDYACTAAHACLTPEMIALELDITERAVKMLTQRQTALEESAIAMCKTGKVIPGWEAHSVMGSLAWDVDPIAVGDAMGTDLRAPAKAITPTQAKNRKLLPADTIKSLASRSPGGVKLKRVDHTRAKRILS